MRPQQVLPRGFKGGARAGSIPVGKSSEESLGLFEQRPGWPCTLENTVSPCQERRTQNTSPSEIKAFSVAAINQENLSSKGRILLLS